MSIIGNNNISQKYPDFVVNTFTKKIANLSDLDDIVEARRNLGVAGNDTLLDIKDRIYNNADLNQYTTTGIYYQLSNTDANTGKNYPTPHAGYLEVISISSTFVYQYYKKYQSNEYYIRTKYNGVWSEWERLLKDSDISVINAELDDKISYEHDNTRPINEISVNNQISIRTTDNFNSYLKFVDSVFDENVMLYGDSGKNFHIRTGGEQGFTYNFPVNGIPDSDNDVVTNKFLEDSKDFSTNRDNHTGTQSIETISGLQGSLDSKVSIQSQNLTEAEKTQARNNIGAFSTSGGNIGGGIFFDYSDGSYETRPMSFKRASNPYISWALYFTAEDELSFDKHNPETGTWLRRILTLSGDGGVRASGLITTRSDQDSRIMLLGQGDYPDVDITYSGAGNVGFYDRTNRDWYMRINSTTGHIYWKGGYLSGEDGNINGTAWSSRFGGSGWAAQAIKNYIDNKFENLIASGGYLRVDMPTGSVRIANNDTANFIQSGTSPSASFKPLYFSNMISAIPIFAMQENHLEAQRIRITRTDDLSATSTNHGFQIGPDNGVNLGIDNNEIIARTNGAITNLGLNETLNITVDRMTIGSGKFVNFRNAGWVDVPEPVGNNQPTTKYYVDTNKAGISKTENRWIRDFPVGHIILCRADHNRWRSSAPPAIYEVGDSQYQDHHNSSAGAALSGWWLSKGTLPLGSGWFTIYQRAG